MTPYSLRSTSSEEVKVIIFFKYNFTGKIPSEVTNSLTDLFESVASKYTV